MTGTFLDNVMIFGSESELLQVLGQQFQKQTREIAPEKNIFLGNFVHRGEAYAECSLLVNPYFETHI